MRRRIVGLAVLGFAPSAWAQTCSNYGTASGGACVCPPGLGGSDCSQIVCDNPLLNQTARATLSATSAGNAGSAGCGSQCTSGFDGVSCNVCTSTSACQSVISAIKQAAGPSLTGGGIGGSASSSAICSTDPGAYSVNFGQCNVINPTLQSVFPGVTFLDIQRSADPSSSLLSAPTVSSLSANTAFAQLYYAANTSTAVVEQFYCSASNCSQSLAGTSLSYTCTELKCTCNPGTAFCGGGGPLDLTGTLDGLAGPLTIECDSTSNATSVPNGNCYFKQSLLQNLFGANGLSLSGCAFGECVSQTVADNKRDQLTGQTTSGGDSLSGGVIAGLAVVGALLAAIAALLLWGWLQQKKAAKGRGKAARLPPWVGGAQVSWSDIRYTLPANAGLGAVMGLAEGMRRSAPGLPVEEMEKGHENAGPAGVPEKRRWPHPARGASDKVLLDGVGGRVEPGTMMAILGPSGAGKSTLIDVLSGQRKSGRIAGSRSVVVPTAPTVRPTIGFVDQSDVLSPHATVREALTFAARLKLPESVADEDKLSRVDEVLAVLGLQGVAGSRIGSEERRGISGGERRRLSIGLELLSKPAVLFLDEPTSGLDSVSAMRVVRVLKNLARPDADGRPGTTVIATVHQPSSQIFHSFDTISVLALGGRQVYVGPTEAAVEYFAARGLTCPPGYNPADYLLEIASEAHPQATTSTGSNPSRSTESLKHRHSPVDPEPSTPPSPAAATAEGGGPKARKSKPVTTALTQFQVLAGREWRTLLRDPTLFGMHILIACILGVFIGGIYFQVSVTIAGFQNRVGSLFFLGSVVAFSALSALNNLTHVRTLFMRERAAGLYSPPVWLLARIVFDIVPLRLIPTIIMSTIAYWMVGLTPTAKAFFKFLLVILEFSIALVLFNFLLAGLFRNGGTAILVASIINLGQMAYAGFFTNLKTIPPVLRWIQWLAPLKYALEALTVNEISSGLLIKDTLEGVNIQVSATLIMNLLFGFQSDAYYRDVLVLFGWIGLFAILLVATVFVRLREVR